MANLQTRDEIEQFWNATDDAAVAEEIAAQDRLARLASCSIEEMILVFRHYRLFTVKHIDDLAIVFARLPFSEFKAFLSKVLFEEFGMETDAGYANNHVSLLDAFLVSLGASPEFCSDPGEELPSNVELLAGITDAVTHRSLPHAIGLRGMGTECLCQVYLTTIFNMVEENPHFIERKAELDLRFESLHRGPVEAEHRIQMRSRIAELAMREPEMLREIKEGYEVARTSFHRFFENIYRHIDGDSPRAAPHAPGPDQSPTATARR